MNKKPHFAMPGSAGPGGLWTAKRLMQAVVLGAVAVGYLWVLPPSFAAPGSWTQGAGQPGPASTTASCVLDGILYVMGGHGNKACDQAFTNLWAYEPKTDSWSNRAPLPTGRHFLGQCAVPVDGVIYLVGGFGKGFPGAVVREVAAYNPKTDTWTNGASMPTGRGLLTACAVDGIIYAIGGYDGSQELATVEAYDPRCNRWTIKRLMPQRHWFMTASAVNGRIYVFYGCDVFVYDPRADSWTTKTHHFSPFSWGLMSAEVNGTIYLFGGFTEDWNDGNDLTVAYDPAQDQFTACRKMPRKRGTTSCGVIGAKVYLSGGVSKEPRVNSDAVFHTALDVFDPQGGVMPQILSLQRVSSGSVRLVWQAEPNILYGIESAANVTGQWLPTGNKVLATNSVADATCTTGGDPKRFFRVFETK